MIKVEFKFDKRKFERDLQREMDRIEREIKKDLERKMRKLS